MGEISEALSRARQEESAEDPKPASDGRAPRRHAPLYDPPPAKAERETGIPRHELGSLREPEASVEEEPRQAPPVASPSTESQYCAIPDDREKGWVYRLCTVEPDSADAVRFRHFAVRMRGVLDASSKPSVLVTSAIQGEGKTTVAINMALALASIAPELRIALVDLDLRRGRVARELGSSTILGVDDVLAGRAELDDIIIQTSAGRLDILPCARTNPDAHALFGDTAADFFRQLHARYDYVICDGPPVLPVPDSPLMAKHVGGCLAVVASGRTRHAAFRDVMDLIPHERWYGVFMNESTSSASKDRYGYRSSYAPEASDTPDAGDEAPVEPVSRAARSSAARRAIAAATSSYAPGVPSGSSDRAGGSR